MSAASSSLALSLTTLSLALCLLLAGALGESLGRKTLMAAALYLCAYYLGSSVIGYAGGYLWQHFGWLALLAALAGLLLLAIYSARRL
ncbi:Inner membrane transport protein YnfM [compost metagenome]